MRGLIAARVVWAFIDFGTPPAPLLSSHPTASGDDPASSKKFGQLVQAEALAPTARFVSTIPQGLIR